MRGPATDTPGYPPLAQRRREQRAWYVYDWANSAYVTTIGTVLFAPYLTSVAETAACGAPGTLEAPCRATLTVLGLPVSPGSLAFYVVTVSTIFSALVLPVVGALADRSARKKHLMGAFAWTGAGAAMAMVTVTDGHWLRGAALLTLGNVCLGMSLVVYDAILCEIATPDERDAVSSHGWALGYLGGGLLLVLNLALVLGHDSLGVDKGTAVRLSLFSAGLWWAVFTLVPVVGLRNRAPVNPVPQSGSLLGQGFGQLWTTLRELRAYPMTLLFLLAYLFFNDGIQTVIVAASVYGEAALGHPQEVLIGTILLVQFVAFGGALLFGRLAGRWGSRRMIMAGLVCWIGVVTIGFVLPARQVLPFLGLAVLIGIVLGGTQALSRSLYSQLVPKGREAEYFSLYQAGERGTSWLGTALFGLVHQLTGSYRPAIVALMVFFIVGLALLARVDVRRGIAEAGNAAPAVV
ncbi:MAG TPA: MFS transporter [Actinomycetes bacterium]|nr:MFS transporter [Actinomycetes bacterium]